MRSLARADLTAAARLVTRLWAGGDAQTAALGELLIASLTRDESAIEHLALTPAGNLLRADPELHALLVWTRYWNNGLDAASSELRQLLPRLDLLPDLIKRQDLLALATLAELVDGRALLTCDEGATGVADWLPGYNLPIISARVNDLPPEYFILDTGASTSVLNQTYCDKVGLGYARHSPKNIYDGSGNAGHAYPALVDSLTLGGLTLRNWTAQVITLGPQFRLAGLLSPGDTFRHLFTLLDFSSRTLHVSTVPPETPAGGWRVTRLFWNLGQSYVKGRVNDAAGLFLFDTGAGANLLTPSFAAQLWSPTPISDEIASPTALGATTITRGGRALLQIDGAAPRETDFLIKERHESPQAFLKPAVAGYVAQPWLQGRKILFPPRAGELFFTDAQRPERLENV